MSCRSELRIANESESLALHVEPSIAIEVIANQKEASVDNVTIASVIAEGGLTRCISATATMAPGAPGLRITGVTDLAACDIRALVLAAMGKRGIRLPERAVAVELAFDVPFEHASELGFAVFVSVAETICPSSSP
ncbi:hypothetical protein [Adlercreutzia sp. ZJ473]|uniref:hypothetical protein n=1 Tax=Adlercreutzia sp. ZJ473 TaxID=2722822 RepID=UPI0015582D07|nr:hypothetical protein [Adlercreutzia sp. ZJ473]